MNAEIPQTSEGNTYLVSGGNVLSPLTKKEAATATLEWLASQALSSGAHGVDAWMLRPVQAELRLAQVAGSTIYNVYCGHQSPRRETLKDVTRDKRAAQVIIGLPYYTRSLEDLARLAGRTPFGYDLPTIFYEDTDPDFFKKNPFSHRAVQMTYEAFRPGGYGITAKSPTEFIDQVGARGFNEVVYDMAHTDRVENKMGPAFNWERTIEAFAQSGKLSMVHISSRLDLDFLDPQEMLQNLSDLTRDPKHPPENAPILQRLKKIKDLGWHGIMTLEITPDAVAALTHKTPSPVGMAVLYGRALQTIHYVMEKPHGV